MSNARHLLEIIGIPGRKEVDNDLFLERGREIQGRLLLEGAEGPLKVAPILGPHVP